MALIVQKYGGTSVANIEKINNVADRVIKEYKKGHEVVVVVSAMGDTTDELIGLMKQITDQPNPREFDMLLTTGEQVSIALLTMAIQEKGYKAISLTGSQVKIETDDHHSKAEIMNIDNSRLRNELEEGKIIVVAGFQGINSQDDFTTLGRGGSDTTAVALAISLNADRCEIYSDVDGIYTTDPRIVSSAAKLDYISYEEMLELANLGAKVLHPRSVELAKSYNLKLYIASSFNYRPGTIVEGMDEMEKRKSVTGITYDKDEVKITVQQVPDEPGIAGQLFTRLAENNINVDMIIQNLQHNKENDITFTVNKEDLIKNKEYIMKVSNEIGSDGVEIDQDVAKVSIVGAGMITTPGIAAKMFTALGENKINIQMITTSDIKVSCLINADDADKALEILHESFELDKQ
ncbi:aspartate kinase [Iocasia frigidifontis]|uniref:Aspartokinase n=1 Tax=Iocasia fonsfrigidae TaxID=2682810 RepID=A0A8A7KFV3_9FIRM|nr:aspartate kinase [Iocasia fonsfrigidae]QTL98389.1 aspartate kinase [Iocasia fonsfrigidae]